MCQQEDVVFAGWQRHSKVGRTTPTAKVRIDAARLQAQTSPSATILAIALSGNWQWV
jgi:hypothetical protein